ncbi:MAG TPA: CDP-alcohol phosphatidyltransferase family protein [Ktedonobacterales bacterium]|jgi:CDP-diacylglycerol--glycerol-3-phosphate 3-phosphatidyltransferase
MIGTRVQQFMRRLVERAMQPLARTGITPNMLTLIGLLLTIFTAGVIAFNHLRIGGILVLGAGIFDMFDGAMARVSQKSSKFGAFFDSTLDRYAEGLLLLGIIIYAQLHLPTQRIIGDITTANLVVWLTYIAALSSLMISYTRARAEGLGLECKMGLLARPERVILLAAGLLIGGQPGLLWTMLVMAVLTTITAIQRIVHIWRITRPPKADPAIATETVKSRNTQPQQQTSEQHRKSWRAMAKRLKTEQPLES